MTIEIFIAIFSLIVGVNTLWEKVLKGDRSISILKRLNWNDYIIIVGSILLFLFTVINVVKENRQAKIVEERDVQLQSNVDTVKTNSLLLLSSTDSMNLTSLSIEKKVDSLQNKSYQLLFEREQLLNEFERVNNLLRRSNYYDNLAIIDKRPEIGVFGEVYWSVESEEREEFLVRISFQNFGYRTAVNFSCRGTILPLTDSLHVMNNLLIQTNEVDRIPQHNSTNKVLTIELGPVISRGGLEFTQPCAVWIEYSYTDPITKKKYKTDEVHFWNDYSVMTEQYRLALPELREEVLSYLSMKKIR